MINPMDLTGRTILVTGASSGLGRDIAVLLSQLGARVVLSGRRAEALRETLALLEGGDHQVAPRDLSDVDAIPGWMKELAATSGPLDGLVHSAGVNVTRPLRMVNAASIHEHFGPNVDAAFGLTKGFRQRGVVSERGGAVVYLSSVAGLAGDTGMSLYSATKGAVVAMTRSIAVELAREKIRVNCVAPGMVLSGMGERAKTASTEASLAALAAMHPMGLGGGRDVAYGVAFLLAETSGWITGTTLVVDGGYLAR